ncbi:Uncharacterised protein [uncultured Eubacterium sp.]|nr:Uncharacterised protein [uncultured Eubacterium sp.]
MIVNNCYNSTEPNTGLSLNLDRTLLKYYLGDTDLLISPTFNESAQAVLKFTKSFCLII